MVFILLLCLALLVYVILRRIRIRHYNPKYVPTKYLKKKWSEWLPSPVKKRYSTSLQDRRSIQERRSPSPANTLSRLQNLGVENAEGRNHDDTPNRHASIRSIMTLPAYSADVRETEQVIGREGEREGMDTVVEFPETQGEEETRREEEMESLYQIRVRRREERAAREERRRLRREARARNDRQALEALRRASRRARSPHHNSDGSREEMSAAEMLEEYRNRGRDRRFASVDYGALGVARHDGSRVRANSNESDRPLLDSAASIASPSTRSQPGSSGLPNNSSVTLATNPRGHAYNQSTSSLGRFTTNAADLSDYDTDDASDIDRAPTPYGDGRPSTSRGRRSSSTNGRSVYTGNAWGNRSSVDLGNHSMDRLPHGEPPRYEESVRGYSTDQIARGEVSEQEPEPQGGGQSSYSRGRRFGLPRGWGGRKQTRDEETGHAMTQQPSGSRSTAAPPTSAPEDEAPPYRSRPTSEIPSLPELTHLPSIEVTPFTPIEPPNEADEHEHEHEHEHERSES